MGTGGTMQYCPYCGKELPGNACFCSFCGRKIKDGMISGSDNKREHYPMERKQSVLQRPIHEDNIASRRPGVHSYRRKTPKRKSAPVGVITLAVVAIALISLIVFFPKKANYTMKNSNGEVRPAPIAGVDSVSLFENSDNNTSDFSDFVPYTTPNFYVGVWEQKYLFTGSEFVSGSEFFIFHVDFHSDGDVVLWDGYEYSEKWDSYSGSYSVLSTSGYKALLELDVVSGEDGRQYITQIEVELHDDQDGPDSGAMYIHYVGGDNLGVIYEEDDSYYHRVDSEHQEAVQLKGISLEEAQSRGGVYILRNERFFPLDVNELAYRDRDSSIKDMGMTYDSEISMDTILDVTAGDQLVTFDLIRTYELSRVYDKGFCCPCEVWFPYNMNDHLSFWEDGLRCYLPCETHDIYWLDEQEVVSVDSLSDILAKKGASILTHYLSPSSPRYFIVNNSPVSFTAGYFVGTQYYEYELKINTKYYRFEKCADLPTITTRNGYFIIDTTSIVSGEYYVITVPTSDSERWSHKYVFFA